MSAHLLLRQAREARGLSLEEAAGATRIEARYLSLIEHGHIDQLPAGPMRRAWVLSYAAFLEVPPNAIGGLVPPAQRPGRALAPGVVWGLSGLALVLLSLAVGDLAREWWSRPPAVDVPEVVRVDRGGPDQHVRLRTLEPGWFRVMVDGAVAMDRRAEAGERLAFDAHDRVEVHLPTAGSASVSYNGEAIAPQGRLDEPRRLLFIDDVQAP